MRYKRNAILKSMIYFIILFSFSINHVLKDDEAYLFNMYPSQNNQTPYIIYANTPSSELLTFNASDENSEMTSEKVDEYTYSNISSLFFYKNQYLVKTCFGPNKIMEVIPKENIDKKKETSNLNFTYNSQANFKDSNSIVFCYSTIIKNLNKNFPDENAIMTLWSEKTSSPKVYQHKYILFYPDSQRFSQPSTLHSDDPSFISSIFPQYCTTFRETDIFCTITEEKKQFVLETNRLLTDSANNPSIFSIDSFLGIGSGKNLRPYALDKQYKSIFGGYYDAFILEHHDEKTDETSLVYSLYRKNKRFSLIPVLFDLNLFSGLSIKDSYIGFNLFNFKLPNTDESLFIYIQNKRLYLRRIDYSLSSTHFKKLDEVGLGYYSTDISPKCQSPKLLQSSYINNFIEYNDSPEEIKAKTNPTKYYKYQRDISLLLSCSDSEKGEESQIIYTPKIIEMPQCLFDLDDLNGLNYHKINFYMEKDEVILDFYSSPEYKSFRNVGITFYKYEEAFDGLIRTFINMTKANNQYVMPAINVTYYNITSIKFIRRTHNFVPTFRKKFYLNYRVNKNYTDENTTNILFSNLCAFQIKFFPWPEPNPDVQGTDIQSDYYEEEDQNKNCNISFCAYCISDDEGDQKCERCDTSEIKSLILDNNTKSKTYGKCICDHTLGFIKEPLEEYSMCICQEDYYFYNSTDLCWPKGKLENGPYYIREIDDISEIPIYTDCYYTCAKCEKGGNETHNNCLKCKDGFAYISDDIIPDTEVKNCIDINDIGEGYHQEEKDHFIKCHDNCISCSQKSEDDKEYCTECKNYVPFMLKESFSDESFNCLEKKCDLNEPSLIYAYNENSYQCFKNCDHGVQPYNSNDVCWQSCSKDFLFLDEISKKCYDNCTNNQNSVNIYTNYTGGLCIGNCAYKVTDDKICYICDDPKKQYQDNHGFCIDIPKQCLTVDIYTGLCTKCNDGYYPLKEDLTKSSFNCFGSKEEIYNVTNKTNYYFNDTLNYWDECYEACESCYGYGSENRQRCNSCKPEYHYVYYFENKYHNCRLNLSSYENCTSTQEDIYKYKDFCHFCKEGYSFVYNTDKCMSNEYLENGPFYENKTKIIKDYNTGEEIEVKIYMPCYKTCQSCKEKGDMYDHKCTECKRGYKFEDNSTLSCIVDPDFIDFDDSDGEGRIADEDWFKLGNERFSYYQVDKCFMIFYEEKIFLISNKKECESICPDWVDDIKGSACYLRKYNKTFGNMTRENYTDLLQEANVYEEIKDNVNLIINRKKEKNIIYHLTNFVTESPNYLSTIRLNEKIRYKILDIYNITSTNNLLVMKADIKRPNIQSTQVEYQFYNPELINQKINFSLISKRRLDGDEDDDLTPKISIDVPVEWTEDQKSKIDELSRKGVDAFNSSESFYLDGCNQYTTDENKDLFLEDRKKDYYPDIAICEDGCVFVKYNIESGKVTCDCNYKLSTDNYDKVDFVKKEVDGEFQKKNYLENLKSMKCLEKIFEIENLKKNPGFFVMIIFIIIFVVAAILYFFFYGFHSVENLIDEQFEDEKLTVLLKGDKLDKNLQESDDKDGKVIEFDKKSEKPKTVLNPAISNNEQNETHSLSLKKKNNPGANNTKTDSMVIQGSKNSRIDLKHSTDSKIGPKDIDAQSQDREYDFEQRSRNSRRKEIPPLIDNTSSSDALKGHQEKSIDDKEKSIDDKEKSIDNKEKSIDNKEKSIDDKKKSIYDKEKSIDDKEKSIDGGVDFGEDNGGVFLKPNLISQTNEDNGNGKANDNDNDDENDPDLVYPGTTINVKPNAEKTKKQQGQDLINEDDDNDDPDLVYEQNNPSPKENEGQDNSNHGNGDNDDEDMEYNIGGDNQNEPNKGIKISDVSDFDVGFDEERASGDKLKDNSSMYSGKKQIDYSEDSRIANPPLKKENPVIKTEVDILSSERIHLGKSNANVESRKSKSCTCLNGISDEKRFLSIYISGLKKHHIVFYTFFNWFDKNNMSLKLSFFSFSLHLYFGLNTILVFDLSVSDSYFDKTNSKPGFIIMNLLLPFVIITFISFLIKKWIMPQYFMKKVEDLLKKSRLIEFMNENKIEVEKPKERKGHRSLKNQRNKKKEEKKYNYGEEYEKEKESLRNEINAMYKKYFVNIIIYHVVCFLILAFNWYMMTSFCSIYRNTGVKLITNSFISLAVSLIAPFILGLIPSLFGFLGFTKLYQFLNRFI